MPWLCSRGHVRPGVSPKPPSNVAGLSPEQVRLAMFSGSCTSCGSIVADVSRRAREGVGYHYCSRRAWGSIEREGLAPYPLARGAVEDPTRRLLFELLGGDVPGIYLWAQPHVGPMHTGDVVLRAQAHRTWQIVLLRVTFELSDLLPLPIVFGHTGGFVGVNEEDDQWLVHEKEPAILLARPVPPERLTLLGDWDLEALLAVPPSGEATAEPVERRSSRTAPGTPPRPRRRRGERRRKKGRRPS